MNRVRLIDCNLVYHWRGNLAVVLGVMVGCAVLTGALIVGDSLRGSLRDRAEKQLGWVERILVTPHLLHESIASELKTEHACPVLLLQGTANAHQSNAPSVDVTVLGVDREFWFECPQPQADAFWSTNSGNDVVLSRKLADDLHVAVGERVSLHLPKMNLIPAESSLGQRDADRARTWLVLTIKQILDGDHFGSRFSPLSNSADPRNAFVPLAALQLALQDASGQAQPKIGIHGRINSIFAKGNVNRLQAALQSNLTLDDWSLVLRDPDSRTRDLFAALSRRPNPKELHPAEYRGRIGSSVVDQMDKNAEGNLRRDAVLDFYQRHRPYLSLESQQLILSEYTVNSAMDSAKSADMRAAPTFVYLADSLKSDTDSHPYVLVAAVDPTQDEPLIPAGVKGLADDEIVFVNTPTPLLKDVAPGSSIRMSYYDPEKEELLHADIPFKLKGLVPLEGAAADPDMTPDIPGVTDRKDLDWDLPRQLHYDEKRLKPEDRQFWDSYRTTPRAYITLKRGQELWQSRFGKATSIRIVPSDRARFEQELLKHLKPQQGSLAFNSVRADRIKSAENGTDFTVLFLGFSIFIIVASLLLVGLLFRLNLDLRSSETGLLLALGYRGRTVRALLLTEGAIVAILGGLLGVVLALVYARLLLWLLAWWWPEHLEQSFLKLHIIPMTLVIGFSAMIVVAILTIFWAVRGQARIPASALLAGASTDTIIPTAAPGATKSWSRYLNATTIAVIALVLAVASLIGGFFVHEHEVKAATFFASGLFLLVTMLSLFWAALRRTRHALIHGHGPGALGRLGIRNASRHPLRSLLTAGLLACAAFVVVAVQSFRKEAGTDLDDKHSGSGGFSMLAQTDLPVYHDLSSSLGQKELLDQLRQRLQDEGKPADTITYSIEDSREAVAASTIYSCRFKPGDDASCLNLGQPGQPRMLGVSPSFIQDGCFQFSDSLASTPDEKTNPWLLLERAQPDGSVPIILDTTTAKWTLHESLGGRIQIAGPTDNAVNLKVVGLLTDSIFQSEILMSSRNLEQIFPNQGGYPFALIAAPKADRDLVRTLFTTSGYQVTSARDRLDSYLQVENTYLATFQALGSLGLVLGTLGLAVVLLRSVWERRAELALLRALGYRKGQLGWLVLAENAWLLLLGLAIGTVAALLAITPQLIGGAGAVPWLRLFGMLIIVAAVGAIAGAIAIASSLKAELIPALRRE